MSRRAILTLAAAGMLVFAGWVSNAVSQSKCRQLIAVWLFNDAIERRPFYLPNQDDGDDLRAAFHEVGATYTVLPSQSRSPGKWPCLSIKTNILIPFFVSVNYCWEREAEIGGGATRWYLSFFGEAIEIGEANRYET